MLLRHLAGQLAVAIFDTLLREERLASAPTGYTLTETGRQWLVGLGLNPRSPSSKRRFACRCLDWSERRDHLAGQLADEIYQHDVKMGWLRRAVGRAVEVPLLGEQQLLPRLNADRP